MTSTLFSKNLSDHTAKSYKELCDEIGVSFEVVRAQPESTPGQGAFVGILAASARQPLTSDRAL